VLSSADRQIEMMNAYLFQRPHDETVIDFTGTATTDFTIAILAGLNWLTHCAKLAGLAARVAVDRYCLQYRFRNRSSMAATPFGSSRATR
jgi:hypothetical protein